MKNRITLDFTLHDAQRKIDEALETHRFVYVIAGRKFGKSAYAIRKTIQKSQELPNQTLWYLAPFHTQAFEIAWMNFLEWIPKEIFLKSREDKKYILLKNGSIIWVKGVQHESILRGSELYFAVLDEFVNMSYYVWKSVLRPMFLKTRGKALFIGTVPDPRIEYVSQDFLDDFEKYLYRPTKDCVSFNFSSFENPYIAREEIEGEIKDAELKGRKTWAEREYLGLYKREFGRVFPFNYNSHVIKPFEIPSDWTKAMAIDPHPNAPTHALWIAISPENKFFVYREFAGDNLTIREFAREVLTLEGANKEYIRKRLIDPTFAEVELKAIGETSIRDMLQAEGLYLEPANRSFETWYFKMLELLQPKGSANLPDIFFFESCPSTIYQIAYLEWDTWHSRKAREELGGKDRPRKKDFHFADCLKYLINADLKYIERDKLLILKQKIKEKILQKRFL